MVETSKIRVTVLESHYVSLEDHGVPLSVCLQLQQLGLQLSQAQWTARHSLGGFSISFFWPALEKNQPVKNSKKLKRRKKAKVKSVSKPDSDQASVIHLKPVVVDSCVKSPAESDSFPIVAHAPVISKTLCITI